MSLPDWVKLLGPWLIEILKIIFDSPKQAASNVKAKKADRV